MLVAPERLERPGSVTELFTTFTRLSIQGFGGVLAIAQRELCERKRWLSHREFVEMLSAGQVLPGPNVCNVALMVGDQFFGWRGAMAALAGMIALPLVVVLAVTALYSGVAQNPAVAGALRGMGAVSAGVIIGTGLRLSAGLRGNPLGRLASGCLFVAAFVLVGVVRWPLTWALLGLGVPACLFAARQIHRNAGG